jgi:Polysaccharide pyruvyl transferase
VSESAVGATTELRSVRAAEHELRFAVSIAGHEHEPWVRSSVPIAAAAEAAAVATLLPALAVGRPLRIEAPVAPAVLDAIEEAQAILCAWARAGAWPQALPFGEPIEVLAEPGESARRDQGGGVAAFFSGGVDSLTTVLRHPEITHLVHIEGFDVPLERTDVTAMVRERIAATAAELGKELVRVETNVRELSDPYLPWVTYYGAALGTVALLLSGEMSRVLIASGLTHPGLYENGSHPLLDHLWGADRVEIVHDGAALSRVAKLRLLADDPTARRMLRVCWQNPGGAYNCGRCEKCLRTMVTLEILGVRDRFEAFPDSLDLDAVAATELTNRPEVEFWLDALELAVEEGARGELIDAVERCLRAAGTELAGPVPRANREPRAAGPNLDLHGLYMRPEARHRLAEASAAVFLVGSYEGWGNYGDLLQLWAALDLIRAELPDAAACPILNIHATGSHERQQAASADQLEAAVPLYFAAAGADTDYLVEQLELVPAILPASITGAVTWLYGGGYLNPSWGVHKLEMARAADLLARRGGIGGCELVSSGLQIDPGWARELDDRHRGVLTGLRMVGVRDELSARAAASLAGERVPSLRTGDDAIGLFKGLGSAAAREADDSPPESKLAINLHYCPGEWVADDPDAMRDFVAGLVVELARAGGAALEVQPLIAYEDPRMSERSALAELTAAISARLERAEIRTPIVLTASGLSSGAAAISGAQLTVGSSYHVALTSLMLGVPAVLPRANPYYAQKAETLRSLFSLPAALLPDPATEPGAAAAGILEAVRSADGSPQFDLEAGRARAIRLRLDAETALADELAAGVGSGRARAAGAPGSIQITRAQVEMLFAGLERARARAEALEATTRWQTTRLDDISRSASWRLTAPIRAAKAALRRHRRSP